MAKGTPSDTLACHYADHWKDRGHIPSAGMLREQTSMEILWKGDPIRSMRSFGTLACRLCLKEKVFLLKTNWSTPSLLINRLSEIHGGCRHRAKFHRLQMVKNSADDSE